jgi:serine/threonine-protein kinase
MRAALGIVAAALITGVGATAAHAQDDAGSPLHPCSSQWMTKAGAAWGLSYIDWAPTPGATNTFMVSLAPTLKARRERWRWPSVWQALRQCVEFPADLSTDQETSLRQQLACHAWFSLRKSWKPWTKEHTGGERWDLEAWRAPLSDWQLSVVSHKCNWGQVAPPLAEGGRLRIYSNLATGRCLDSNARAEVYTLPCNGGDFQKWLAVAVSRTDVTLTNRRMGRCLDSDAAGRVYTLRCNGGQNQYWEVIINPDNTRTFRDRATRYCLDSNGDGAVYTLTCNGGPYQRWPLG